MADSCIHNDAVVGCGRNASGPVIWYEVQRVDRRMPFVVGTMEVQHYLDQPPGIYIIKGLCYSQYEGSDPYIPDEEDNDEQDGVVPELRKSPS